MGYGPEIPANQVGGSKNLWIIIDYGLSGLWVRRELTVLCPAKKCVPHESLSRGAAYGARGILREARQNILTGKRSRQLGIT
jgi:hypothetical protein